MSTPAPLCGNYKEDLREDGYKLNDECPLCKEMDSNKSIKVGFHPSRASNLYKLFDMIIILPSMLALRPCYVFSVYSFFIVCFLYLFYFL